VRLLLVAIEVEEGRSIGDVARSWGVSRQLASRWVQESTRLRD
jgi:transposase-like protein